MVKAKHQMQDENLGSEQLELYDCLWLVDLYHHLFLLVPSLVLFFLLDAKKQK